MTNRVIDADGHICEPPAVWNDYVEKRHRADTIVVVRGPAETHTRAQCEPGVIAVEGLTLPQVAALLHDATLYLGNDSGISHLAAAVGARGVVVFGPSDPAVWAPRSTRLRVVHAPVRCMDCPANTFCVHRLPVESVVDALDAQATAPPRSAQL